MSQWTVEFFGPARAIAGVPMVELELEDKVTGQDVLRALAASYPAFCDAVIDPANDTLNPSFLLSLDGNKVIRDFDAPLPPGTPLVLLSALMGG